MKHSYEETVRGRRRVCVLCGAFQWKSGAASPWQPMRLSTDDCSGAIKMTPSVPYSGGPGYLRMRARLGDAGCEALRLDTLQLKQDAVDRAAGEHNLLTTDRTQYKGYPEPRRRRRKGASHE